MIELIKCEVLIFEKKTAQVIEKNVLLFFGVFWDVFVGFGFSDTLFLTWAKDTKPQQVLIYVANSCCLYCFAKVKEGERLLYRRAWPP